MDHYAPQLSPYPQPGLAASPTLRYDYTYAYATAPSPSNLPYSGFSTRSPARYDHEAFTTPGYATYGGPSSSQLATTTTNYPYDDTVLAIPGPSSSQDPSVAQSSQLGDSGFRGVYAPTVQHGWTWASASPYAVQRQGQEATSYASGAEAPNHFKTRSVSSTSSNELRTPTAQLPTPAAMAVLLHSTARTQSLEANAPPQTQSAGVALQNAANESFAAPQHTDEREPVEGGNTTSSQSDPPSRERRHGCWMCHKSFDRPSTLRKHLLVHTGEKAFKCDTCGRRFGVASNLNRHVRKCILKPVNTIHRESTNSSPTTTSSPATTETPVAAAVTETSADSAPPTTSPKRKRRRDTINSNSNSSSNEQDDKPPVKPKRRRRAPSPSKWIPTSLLRFDLNSEDMKRSVTVPLPPVIPSRVEERNSWDENDERPYHPLGWTNKLPGPGLGHGFGLGMKDLGNLNLAGTGGFILGRLSVY